MLSLLQNIAEIIITAVTLIIHIIESFVNFILNIPNYTAFLISSVNILPSVLIPFVVASISIYVIYLLIDRGAK